MTQLGHEAATSASPASTTDQQVAIVGLGYVGLPLATCVSREPSQSTTPQPVATEPGSIPSIRTSPPYPRTAAV